MRLSTKIRYGYRLMVDLASHWGEQAMALKDISTRQNISLLYLRQIIMSLEAAGLVRSQRGSKGGYALAKNPEDISLIDIIHALEGPLSMVECIDDPTVCDRADHCATRLLWKEMSAQLESVLESKSLASLAQKQLRLEHKPLVTNGE